MKKIVLCLLLLIGGCKNGYTLIRNPKSDDIKIGLIIDEDEKDLIDGINIQVDQIYVCKQDCVNKMIALEKEYVDGMILIGEKVFQSFQTYENINRIPTIYIKKESQIDALQRIYPEYEKWIHVTSEKMECEKAEAYYYDEGITVHTEKPFFQNHNDKSICTLIEDKSKFEKDLNEQIEQLIQSNYYTPIIIVEWIKK